ncbi:hypothetical protein OROMI_003391 [Orobanche minor]
MTAKTLALRFKLINVLSLENWVTHFVCVLVKIDMEDEVQNNIAVECIGHYVFPPISYGNLPEYCNHCSIVGHSIHYCKSPIQPTKSKERIPSPAPAISCGLKKNDSIATSCFTPKQRSNFKCSSWNLDFGYIRLSTWVPDFNPYKANSSKAQVWVQIYELPIENWHPQLLFTTAKTLALHFKLINVLSLENWVTHFVCVLVKIYMKDEVQNNIAVECIGHNVFPPISYGNLPEYCNHCSIVGHSIHYFKSPIQPTKSKERIPSPAPAISCGRQTKCSNYIRKSAPTPPVKKNDSIATSRFTVLAAEVEENTSKVDNNLLAMVIRHANHEVEDLNNLNSNSAASVDTAVLPPAMSNSSSNGLSALVSDTVVSYDRVSGSRPHLSSTRACPAARALHHIPN